MSYELVYGQYVVDTERIECLFSERFSTVFGLLVGIHVWLVELCV